MRTRMIISAALIGSTAGCTAAPPAESEADAVVEAVAPDRKSSHVADETDTAVSETPPGGTPGLD